MISVIIPTYKNKEQFLKNLNHNLKYLRGCQIIIVNDNPEVSLKNDIDSRWSLPRLDRGGNDNAIIFIENEKNLGFGKSINRGVEKATGNYLLLLNDDVIINDDSYLKTLELFEKNNKLFAVSFAQKEKDGSMVGKNRLFFSNGLFQHSKASNLKFGKNSWAEGGAAIFDKKKFNELRGFDSLYAPFYWEDIDLSSRARKKGWLILFNPNMVVTHHHETTIGKSFGKSFIKTTAYRNQIIFTWKNLDSPEKIINHIIYLPVNLTYMLLKGETEFLSGFVKALAVYFLR